MSTAAISDYAGALRPNATAFVAAHGWASRIRAASRSQNPVGGRWVVGRMTFRSRKTQVTLHRPSVGLGSAASSDASSGLVGRQLSGFERSILVKTHGVRNCPAADSLAGGRWEWWGENGESKNGAQTPNDQVELPPKGGSECNSGAVGG